MFLPEYLDWHYHQCWLKIIVLWRNLSLFPFYYFSVPHHLKTLFSPWKRQLVSMKPGFHFDDFLNVVFFNLFSRIIGACVRTATILYGLTAMLICFILGLIPVLVWPIIPFFSLPLYLSKKPHPKEEAKYLLTLSGRNLKNLALILFNHEEGRFVSSRLGLDPTLVHNYFAREKDTGDFDILNSRLAGKNGSVFLSDLFLYLSESYRPLQSLLEEKKLKNQDIYQTALWFEQLAALVKTPLLFDLQKIKSLPGIGAEWSYGYTVEFDKYAQDLSKHISVFPYLVGRENEVKEIERVLLKSEGNNALIVGEPGIARHILIETLAHRIKIGACPQVLSHKRILSLKMHSLISAKASVNEVKGLVSDILQEAEYAGNITVVIDDFDKFVTSQDNRVDFSDIYSKFAESSVGFIGITTPYAYHRYIEKNPSLNILFEKIDIVPPSKEIVFTELKLSIVPVVEKKYKIIVTYPAISKVIEDSDRFITDIPFPAKAIELLDQSAVFLVSNKKSYTLLPQHVDLFLEQKLKIPLGDLESHEKEKLINLETLMHQQIINQNEAIKLIASSLRRSRLNISSPNKPIGTFLFLGPTGVGKTETAKALSRIYFGKEENMLRFDMSQYQKEEGLERLIGSAKSGLVGELSSALRDHPYSLLLLDEFEKSNKEIFNLFLTLIDEGYISDSLGHKINAKNTIVIATSNAGSLYIKENISKGIFGSELQQKLIDEVMKERIFSPELLNRFDAVVVFTPLSEGHLKEVAKLMLQKLNNRLMSKEISIAITPELVNKLANIGFDQKFGARAINRVIAEEIEDQIAKRILSNTVKKGEEIQIEI